ncbi:MAG: T9SS type A sorting domain-containing protein [Chitinophagaceae bacterium]|nr:T9SS type A sorting domain-containing protein [Chitinophagaceae bacterium]
MKFFVPLVIMMVLANSIYSQQTYYSLSETWDNLNKEDNLIGHQTQVATDITRINGTKYRHTNISFQVDDGIGFGWLTQFNNLENGAGISGNNVDSFLYQGNNTITGHGIIIFDDVYFNIGAANTMNITNYREPYNFDDLIYLGNPPGGIVVAKNLYFNNGLTTTNRSQPVNGAIVFVNNAGYINTTALSDAQHVDGFVSEINFEANTGLPGHNGQFIFPVGNSTEVYQLQRTGIFTDNEYSLTVGWVEGDPGVTPDLTGISNNPSGTINPTDISHLETGIQSVAKVGFWDWHYQLAFDNNGEAVSMPTDQTITVSIPDLTVYSGVLLPSNLRLVGWNPDTDTWINLSGTSGASGLSKGSTLAGTIPAGTVITALAIASTNAVLLVTFGDFTAKPVKCTALLQWQTYTEQNNSHFNVERSQDGINFNTIAQVSGAGNSTTTKSYEYTDGAPLSGKSYYRITQIDFDGKHSSTPIRSIEMNCEGASLSVYPNPAANQITVRAGKAIMQVNVLSTGGQTVMRYRPSLSQSGGSFNMNFQSLQSGIYLLQIVNKDGTTDIIKLMKK